MQPRVESNPTIDRLIRELQDEVHKVGGTLFIGLELDSEDRFLSFGFSPHSVLEYLSQCFETAVQASHFRAMMAEENEAETENSETIN